MKNSRSNLRRQPLSENSRNLLHFLRLAGVQTLRPGSDADTLRSARELERRGLVRVRPRRMPGGYLLRLVPLSKGATR
jgi:hypothetical protein